MKWPGVNELGTVILPLEKTDFCIANQNVSIYGERFEPKPELHVTLLGTNISAVINEHLNINPDIHNRLERLFNQVEWSYRPSGPVHLLERIKDIEDGNGEVKPVVQKSLVLMLDMKGVSAFYGLLKKDNIIENNWPVPPPHVTLYTHNCPIGIGVHSVELLKSYTQQILPIEALETLHQHHELVK